MLSQVAVARHVQAIEVRVVATQRPGTIGARRPRMTRLYLAFALALGLSACVDEDVPAPPPTQDEDGTDEGVDPGVPVDPPGDNVPGKGDGCGAQLQDDDDSCQ